MKSVPLFPRSAVLLAGLALIASSCAQTTAPATSVGSISAVQTVTLTLTEAATIGSINVLTQGAPNLDFQYASGGTCTVGTAYTTGQTCTVKFTFDPTHPGPRYGAVALYDNASPAKTAASIYLEGTGNGPQVIFRQAPQSTLVAPNVVSAPFSAAFDGAGNVFIPDYTSTGALREILAAGGYTTVLTLAGGFDFPTGVAVDGAGNVFVADQGNNAVKEVLAAGGYTSAITLGSGFSYPGSVAVDGAGNVFVADVGNNAVKEIFAAGGYSTVNTLGSGFSRPSSVAVDSSGNVFVADYSNEVIKEIVAAGGYTTVNTLTSASNTKLWNPIGMSLDGSGNLYFSSSDGHYAYLNELTFASGYVTVLNLLFNGYEPRFTAVDGAGNLIFTQSVFAPNSTFQVERLDFSDPPSLKFANTQAGSTSSDSPRKVTVANNGNQTLHLAEITYPADFPKQTGITSNCSPSASTLAPGSNCGLNIDFSPLPSSAIGSSTPLSEEVTLVDDSLNVANTVHSVAVSGTETFSGPTMSSPKPSSILTSTSATFTWNPGAATEFRLQLGHYVGGNLIFDSGTITTTSVAVTGLPSTGMIHARLSYLFNGTWTPIDYVYYTPTALISPAPGSTLSGSTVTFTWNPGNATAFKLQLGNYYGGGGIYGSGETTRTSVTVSNLPTNGQTIHARLSYLVSGVWKYKDYTYTAQ